MVKSSMLVLCGVFMVLHFTDALSIDKDVGWNLAPQGCGVLSTGADGMVIAHISAGSSADGPDVQIGVIEMNDQKVQWRSNFMRLRTGSEFVVANEIYEVSSIKVLPPRPAPDPGNSRMPGADCAEGQSYLTVRDTKRQVLNNDQQAVILPAQPAMGLWVGESQCAMAVRVVSLKEGQQLVDLEWHEESLVPWKTCGKWKSTSGLLKVNDVLDMHEYGRFRIKMILPKTENHPTWVVFMRD
ncbi:hypothetical protein DWU98_05040 [Dyella monticola]|uniref:Uncharacterized protein n=1 Tax=Dyella monticola TaxID=1927958 RepID=A0A370X5J7_9GAMM|nr:hypothetical protein [Dyella monticola]RDS83693.1 hypothetical protein DWU98_05040 [Dyella monticola]